MTGRGRKTAQFVRLGAPGAAAGARPARGQVALVPGADAPLLPLDLPRALTGAAREQVARRQLRDRLGPGADAVEMRLYHAPGEADRWSRALVADRAALARWRGAAGAARAVLPDYLALPCAEGLWTLTGTDTSVAARLGPGDGFSAAPGVARGLLARALETGAPRAVLRLGPPLPELETMLAEAGVPVLDDAGAVAARGLPVPVVLGHGELSFDLRRDPRAARARLARRALPWRWTVLAAGLAAALWGAADWVRLDRADTELAEVRTRTETLVRRHFVPAGPILDIRAQVARALATAQAATETPVTETGPLDILGRAAEVMATAPATPVRLGLDRAAGVTATLEMPDFGAVDALVAALGEAGVAAQVLEARTVDGGGAVRADLRLRPGGTDGQ